MTEIVFRKSSPHSRLYDLEKIENHFFSYKKNPYISRVEYKKLQTLANDFELPSMSILCGYLKEKLNPITQAISIRNAVFQSPFQDSCDQILYSFFAKKIITPILLGEEKKYNITVLEFLNDEEVNQNLILPKALKTGLEREFFCLEKEVEKNKVNNDSWNFIENQIGQYHKSTLLDVFIERGHFAKDEIEEKAAEVAAYITLQNTIPTVLQNKHLLNFRTNCESAIDRSIKKTAEEKTNEEVSKSPSTRCIKSFVERLGNDKSKTNKEGWSR